MTFNIVKRKSLIVWLYTLKQLKQLNKYGSIHHFSENLKYAVLYVNHSQWETIRDELKKLNFVREVEISHRDEIDMTFKNAIPNRIDPDLKQAEATEQTMEDFFKDLAQEIDHKETDRLTEDMASSVSQLERIKNNQTSYFATNQSLLSRNEQVENKDEQISRPTNKEKKVKIRSKRPTSQSKFTNGSIQTDKNEQSSSGPSKMTGQESQTVEAMDLRNKGTIKISDLKGE